MERVAMAKSKLIEYYRRLDEYLTSALYGKPEEVKVISVDLKEPYSKNVEQTTIGNHGCVGTYVQRGIILPYRITFEDGNRNRIVGTNAYFYDLRNLLIKSCFQKSLEEVKKELNSLIGKNALIRRKGRINLFYPNDKRWLLNEDPEGIIFESYKGDENE
jgi:hypothetical protein